jgi:MFS family permease
MAEQQVETQELPKPALVSAWAPLREPTFRMLWLVSVTANICLWMNDVAAAWLMTSLTTSPSLVALVQTASALPMFLLGLPSGALADILDRRNYFMATQIWVAFTAAILSVAAFYNLLNAPLLLVFVFVNSIGLAMRFPVYAAIVPELVPRTQLASAMALNAVAMNLSRVVGPLVAGLIIASFGDEYVFALNFVMSVLAAFAIARWKREKKPSVLPGERFIGAMRLGLQYVRQSPGMRNALVRSTAFFLHSAAPLALMPLVAKGLGGGAGTYTVLLSSLGIGAIVAVARLPQLRNRWNLNQVSGIGSLIHAAGIAGLAIAPSVWVGAVAMFVAGMGWILAANSIGISAQLALPDWVRARGMAIFQMSIMGSSALGAFIWGHVAEWTGVPASLAITAVSMAIVLALVRVRPLDSQPEDHVPTHPFQEPVPARPIELDEGPVMITIEYLVDESRAREFETVMAQSRSARLRHGAVSWGLFEDLQMPGRFVEYFATETWADFLRRYDRFTAADERLHKERLSFHTGGEPPKISRYLARNPPIR